MSRSRSRPAGDRQREGGFTLIELLVVLVILGLLAALVGPRVLNYLSGAKADAARLQVKALESALQLYQLDNGSYPTTAQGLDALVKKPANAVGWRAGYIDKPTVPLDPWGHPFVYKSPGDQGRSYDLSSLGADGQPGGSGDAADVTSWQR